MKYSFKRSVKKAFITTLYTAGGMLMSNPEAVFTPYGGMVLLGVFLTRLTQDWVKNKDIVGNLEIKH
ncbi:MAG: hypothetical protein ABIK73_07025 [candidate division WOR-3 bacterium]